MIQMTEAEYKKLVTEHAALRAACERAQRLCNEALPKFNWGASFLDANAIELLNAVPYEINAALDVYTPIYIQMYGRQQRPLLPATSAEPVAHDDRLLPCPFCGSSAHFSASDDLVNVRCDGWNPGECLGAGPNCHTEADAAAAWNRRAALAAHKPVSEVHCTAHVDYDPKSAIPERSAMHWPDEQEQQEPKLFSNGLGNPCIEWVKWYRMTYNTTISEAVAAGKNRLHHRAIIEGKNGAI